MTLPFDATRGLRVAGSTGRKPGRLIRRNDGLKGTIRRHDWMPTAFRNTCEPIGHWTPRRGRRRVESAV